MPIYKDFHLKELSYYQTGGLCKTLYQPENKQELLEALAQIHKSNDSFFILGEGSNSLVSDLDWNGSVLSLNLLNKIEKDENKLIAGAGVNNSDFAEFALSSSLEGASWMYGLPGSLGATVRMNARCYGGEISQIVTKVTSFTKEGEEKTYHNKKNDKHLFEAYKKTLFMNNGEIVAEIEATLELASSLSSVKEKMMTCFEDRKSKGQFLLPSCGCVFKNDYRKEVSVPSGLLIDFCGFKGKSFGKAMISQDHANFIVNTGGATSEEILELSLLVRETVWEKLGVWLEYEMEVLGRLPDHLLAKLSEKREEKFNQKDLSEIRKNFQKRS